MDNDIITSINVNQSDILSVKDLSDYLKFTFNNIVIEELEAGHQFVRLLKNEYGGKWPNSFIEVLKSKGYKVTDDLVDNTVWYVSWELSFK